MISTITVTHSMTSCVQPRLNDGLTLPSFSFLLNNNKKNTESQQFGFTKPLSKNLGDTIA